MLRLNINQTGINLHQEVMRAVRITLLQGLNLLCSRQSHPTSVVYSYTSSLRERYVCTI